MTAPRPLSSWNWALAAAAIVLIGMTCMPPPALGQTGSQQSAEAVSAVGPAQVLTISAQKIVLGGARKPFVMELADKKVVAKDKNGHEIPIDAITAGMYVTVLRRAADVTISVSPKQEAQDDKAM